MTESNRMLTSLVQLHSALQEATLPLDLPGVDAHRESRTEMVDQLEDYMIPRLTTIDAPMLAVVGGSTGAGKSTLVNTMVGSPVTQSGLLRPTTMSPVLVHHPDDARWFGQDRILPDLARVKVPTIDPRSLQLVASANVPRGLAILDAPDVDSVEEANRTLAAQLLAAADLWLFVTSAARYADQVPWDFLKQAADRGTAVAIVLDRTPQEAVDPVATHLARMLASRGLKDSPLFIVKESPVDDNGLLPPVNVADIRGWLQSLAADSEARDAVVRQTLSGAIRSVSGRAYTIADAAAEQADAVNGLRDDVAAAYDRARADVHTATADGTLMRGEVLARWQEFVGTGELLRSLETQVGRIRDRLVNAIKGKPQQADRVQVAVESGLEKLLLEHAEKAAEKAAASWRSTAQGKALIASSEADVTRASREFRRQAEQAVREWQQGVLAMVRAEGADKRTSARFMAFGVNGLAVALMMVVFVHTGGVTGAEAGVAGGSAVLGQKLLEAVFGDQAVRSLAARAREDLDRRTSVLLSAEQDRFVRLVDALGVNDEASGRLRQAARRVTDERFAQQQHAPGDHSA
ncbi:GTPase domain-containing protein [Nocardioides alcanivorans]|uniref:GTPase domain-containing protein n=1 Tax=Nocardioides alcanivorans TaxID=2897352 RepID=UPI001F3B22CD|nr:GTPase domain-containing protein [Nocardioides alcanivorans]